MASKPRQPWMKWYWSDWRSDEKLRMCSLAARGLWAEMLALMHHADPYGHLLVSGRSPTETQLAMLAGASPEQIPDLLGELELAEVFSRTQKGVIFSRRMTRDDKKARLAEKNGKSGGNPSLCKNKDIRPSDNPPFNQPDKGGDKAQKPEARSQKEPPPTSSNPEAGGKPDGCGSGGAETICQKFLTERIRLWPNESSLPSPTMTIKAIAQQHIDAGGTVELIVEVMTRGMERLSKIGMSAPVSLSIFRNSIGDAITKHKMLSNNGVKPSDNIYVSPIDLESEKHRNWMKLFERTGNWPSDIRGPAPGQPGCRVKPEILSEFGVMT